MNRASLNDLCEQGQVQLTNTDYLSAAATFATAEAIAWDARDFDTLSRLYLPLQEARRQIRQRCGEGAIRMRTPANARDINQGFVLLAGLGSVTESLALRNRLAERKVYVEAFLGATLADEQGNPLVILLPTADTPLPSPIPRPLAELQSLLSPGCVLLQPADLPADIDRGTAATFAAIMALWERLHTPFLRAAEKQSDPLQRMQAFRETLKVDPACELAHQHLADTARTLARSYPRPLGKPPIA